MHVRITAEELVEFIIAAHDSYKESSDMKDKLVGRSRELGISTRESEDYSQAIHDEMARETDKLRDQLVDSLTRINLVIALLTHAQNLPDIDTDFKGARSELIKVAEIVNQWFGNTLMNAWVLRNNAETGFMS